MRQLGRTFTEPNYLEFENFAKKAFDANGRGRMNDTELKYVYNFLKNHYSQGNRFEISLSSTLYSCKSCQRYLKALKTFVEADGKSIEITFITHPEADGYKELQMLLNN